MEPLSKLLTQPLGGNSNSFAPLVLVSNWLVTAISAIACVLGSWVRLPGMVLAGVTPDWPLIWVVCWSVSRPVWQGAVAGMVAGFLQDAITHNRPTHALGLAIVGALTAWLNKQRSVKEEFITIALMVFGMVAISETVMAIQQSFVLGWDDVHGHWVHQSLDTIWSNYRDVTFLSAVLTSLWAPTIYLPLSLWWRHCKRMRAK